MEFKPIKYQRIYEVDANNIIGRYKMVDNKSKDDITTSKREAEKLTATTVLEDG